MTTTKEDQMQESCNEYLKSSACVHALVYSRLGDIYIAGWKDRAESYEKKLAAEYMRGHADGLKGGEIVDCTGELQHQLSEANARNARLVKSAKQAMLDVREGQCNDALSTLNEAISANSEAVAAWEAEKKDPRHAVYPEIGPDGLKGTVIEGL